MQSFGPSRLLYILPGFFLLLALFAFLGLPEESRASAVGMSLFVAFFCLIAFGVNACTVTIDSAQRSFTIRRHLSRREEVISFDSVRAVRSFRGKGAGINIDLRDGRAVGIPYAGVRRGRKLFKALEAAVAGGGG